MPGAAHPLASEPSPAALVARLEALVASQSVQRRDTPEGRLSSTPTPRRFEATRLARGLLVDAAGERVLNRPLPKFDTVVPFVADPVEYYAHARRPPDPVALQPKHDGSCARRVPRGALLVHTHLSFDNPQASAVCKVLGDAAGATASPSRLST